MAAPSRIDDLRRRVQQDPASIAFAQLAEEYRRLGHFAEAVDTSRAGLAIHPTYLSARVTLGRALLALDRLADAEAELRLVLASAPENLAATRALADVCRRQGRTADALTWYAAALALAPNDPDLERTMAELSRAGISPAPTAATSRPAAPVPEPAAAAPVPASVPDAPVHLAAGQDAVSASPISPEQFRATATVAALEGWLEAIDAARANGDA